MISRITRDVGSACRYIYHRHKRSKREKKKGGTSFRAYNDDNQAPTPGVRARCPLHQPDQSSLVVAEVHPGRRLVSTVCRRGDRHKVHGSMEWSPVGCL